MGVLKKMHLPVRVLPLAEFADTPGDFGLRRLLGVQQEPAERLREWLCGIRENTIYKITDELELRFLFLRLPGSAGPGALLVGPYTTREILPSELLQQVGLPGVPASRHRSLEECLASIPRLEDEKQLLLMFSTLGETLWGGGEAFDIEEVERTGMPVSPLPMPESGEGEDMFRRMKHMEERYAFENELMELVAHGRQQRAELMIAGFSTHAVEQRTSDGLRNMKNYAVVCNTLMRKAAEQGGVHPIYLDSTSSHYARRIEGTTSLDKVQSLMTEMLRSYCRLVRKHSGEHRSPPVQGAIACIEADLAGDLSLHHLAELQNLSAGYLSSLFRRETGKTLTDYVAAQRMEAGARLLRTTGLQIQTIAQQCGIADVNYFSKLFKKYHKVTPRQYREEHRPGHRG